MMSFFTSSLRSIHCPTILLTWVLLMIVFSACTSTKKITYFQGREALDTARYTRLASIRPTVSKIQPDDILSIVVSSLSEESNLLFNFSNVTALTMTQFPGSLGGAGNRQPLGYLVDSAGAVNMPLIGRVNVAGLTLEAAERFIKEQLDKYLKETTVNVRQLNHKFTVIGEVNRPGVYNLLDNHTSLPEVLGTAGDLTVYGRRDNVMLIRTVQGNREIVKIDLTARTVLNSPYYFIQNDDVIYIEPRLGKVTSTDRSVQLVPIFLGVASTLLVAVSLLTR